MSSVSVSFAQNARVRWAARVFVRAFRRTGIARESARDTQQSGLKRRYRARRSRCDAPKYRRPGTYATVLLAVVSLADSVAHATATPPAADTPIMV